MAGPIVITIDLSHDDVEQQKKWASLSSFGTWTSQDWLQNPSPSSAISSIIVTQAREFVIAGLWDLLQPGVYGDNYVRPLAEWQKQTIKVLIANSTIRPTKWSSQRNSGPFIQFDIKINKWLYGFFGDHEGDPYDVKASDEEYGSITILSDQKVPTDWDQGAGVGSLSLIGGSFDYSSGFSGDLAPLTGEEFAKRVLGRIGEIAAYDMSLLTDNNIIADVLGERYTWRKTVEQVTENVNSYIRAIGRKEKQWRFDLTTKAFDATKPSLCTNNLGDAWYQLGDCDEEGSGLAEGKKIPKAFFQGEGAPEQNSTVSNLYSQEISYNYYGEENDIDGLVTFPESDPVKSLSDAQWTAFMADLAEGNAVEDNLLEWKPKESAIDWGWDAWLWDGIAYYTVGWLADWWNGWPLGEVEERQNAVKLATQAAYGTFIKTIIDKVEAGERHLKVPETWDAVFNSVYTDENKDKQAYFALIMNLVIADKEIGRREHSWAEIAKYASNEDEHGNLLHRDIDGEIEKQDEFGEWQDADDIEAKIGAAGAVGFNTAGAGGALPEDKALSEEEIEDRKKFYKQCALMLNVHRLKTALTSKLETNFNKKGVIPFDGRFYMAQCKEDQERLIGNLVASSEGATFFDVPPQVVTYLRPKLRLFKVGNNTGEEIKETEFIFDQHMDLNRVQNYVKTQDTFLKSPFDKGSGCGVKEFSFEFNGTNPAEARNDIKATLRLFFQSFSDFTKSRASWNGEKYRFVDLVIQPKPDEEGKVNNVEVVHPNQYDPSFYRIRAEVGYWEPDKDIPWDDAKGIKNLQRAIRQTNRSFYLCMVDHSIDVNADGTVTIDISYRAYVETALKSLRFDALSTPELIEKRGHAQKVLNEMLTTANCSEAQIKDYKIAMNSMADELRKQSLQSIIRRLLERGKIYIVKVDNEHRKHFLSKGFFEECDIVSVRQVPPTSGAPNAQRTLETIGGQPGEITKILQTEIPEEGFDFTDMTDVTIQFFFFGDLLHTISDTLYKKDGKTPVEGMENTKYILGSFDFDAYTGDKEQYGGGAPVNIAQIPISVDFFSQWFTDNVLSKGNTRKSFPIIEFIRNLSNNVLKNSLLEACVNRKIKKTLRFTTGQLSAYSPSLPATDPLEQALRNGGDIIIKTDDNSALPLAGDSNIEQKDKIKGFYNYLTLNVLGSSLTYTGHGDYYDDIDKGRYHVNIGSNRGILKTISFEKADIQYIREARFLQQGIDGLLQLSAVYNVSLDLYGNTLFYPGMEVFVNPFGMGGTALGSPTQGPNATGGRSMANILGLGGYHTITHVNTSLTPGKFSTSVKALQYYSGDGQGNPNLATPAKANKKPPELQNVSGSGTSDFCQAALGDIVQMFDDVNLGALDDRAPNIEESPTTPQGSPAAAESDGGSTSTETIDDPAKGGSKFTWKYDSRNQVDGGRSASAIEEPGEISFEYDSAELASQQQVDAWSLNLEQEDLIYFSLKGVRVAELMNQKRQARTKQAFLTIIKNGKHHKYWALEGAKEFPTISDLFADEEEIETDTGTPEETTQPPTTTQQAPPPEEEPAEPSAGSITQETIESETTDPKFFMIFGDSQAQGSRTMGGKLLGRFKQRYPGTTTWKFAAHSKPIKWYTEGEGKNKIKPQLEKKPSFIYIFLGGNSTASGAARNAPKLMNLIRETTPASVVVWVLPPPPANHKLYRRVGDYDTRKAKGTAIKNALSDRGDIGDLLYLLDVYDVPYFSKKTENHVAGAETFGPYGNPWTKYDGVHVVDDAAIEALKGLNLYG